YSPSFPLQVGGYSYGIPVTLSTTTLLASGSAGKFTVPVNNSIVGTWNQPGFDDSGWASVNNGVGFEADPPPSTATTLIADSVTDFSGNQGQNNWFYGYWDKKGDVNGTYQADDFIPFPRGTGNVLAPTNYWDGAKWDWPQGNPPFTELT